MKIAIATAIVFLALVGDDAAAQWFPSDLRFAPNVGEMHLEPRSKHPAREVPDDGTRRALVVRVPEDFTHEGSVGPIPCPLAARTGIGDPA